MTRVILASKSPRRIELLTKAGFDVEVCQAVCEKLGWEFEVFGVNWDEKLIQLDAKECDCIWSGMTILDSMKEEGYVISKPYYGKKGT